MLDWDAENIAHVARHGVTRQEVDEAARDQKRVINRTRSSRQGATRYRLIGKTRAGRYLRVILEVTPVGLRPVTAFDGEAADKRAYAKAGR